MPSAPSDPLVHRHTPPASAEQAMTLAQLLEQTETTPPTPPVSASSVREIGGRRDGPEPTRYGDWEKNGRCIDF